VCVSVCDCVCVCVCVQYVRVCECAQLTDYELYAALQ
jgi:hypothetical protein